MTRGAPARGLEASFATLPAAHRRVVARAIGAADASAATLARLLLDPERLQQIVDGLPEAARAGAARLAFAQIGMWTGGRQSSLAPDALLALEERGLAFCVRLPWGGGADAWVAPEDLMAGLQRACARAHAAGIPEAPLPAESVGVPEQILHDVAVIGAMIATGGVRLKADGELYARARLQLLAALGDLPHLGSDPQDVDARLSFALELLQQGGALRVAGEELPGRAPRRELRLDRDLVGLLDRPPAERASLVDDHLVADPEDRLCAPLLDALAGRTVTLAALGGAVSALVGEAGYTLALPRGAVELAGRAAVRQRWLRGDVLLGECPGGGLAVTFSPAAPTSPDGQLCVAQGDFELVLLRPPLPHERAALLHVGEADLGREHVVRLTRERTLAASAALRGLRPGGKGSEDPFLALLRSIAGDPPPNVERTVADWIAGAPRPARLRSAIFVEVEAACEDASAAALGPLLLARLGPGLLAVPADRLGEVEKALRKGGIELEPGLERLSGRWNDDDRSRYEETSGWWRPVARDRTPRPTLGPLRSGLRDLAARVPSVAQRSPAQERILALEVADHAHEHDVEADDPDEMILAAWESGEAIELRYAGADGISTELVRVLELDGARFRVRDLRAGGERWRWVRGVLAAHLAG